jgi:hypothetical protein
MTYPDGSTTSMSVSAPPLVKATRPGPFESGVVMVVEEVAKVVGGDGGRRRLPDFSSLWRILKEVRNDSINGEDGNRLVDVFFRKLFYFHHLFIRQRVQSSLSVSR